MPAVEAAIATGIVDRDNIGIHGHSWGGYQTAFLITQTDRFKAAIAGAPLTNQTSTFVSMPSYDPNSFSDGIGRTEWRMLSEDDHHPLLNKVTQGLYPSGSTIKPAMALAFLQQGVDPKQRVHCPGGLRIGNRFFSCDAVHGSVDMHTAIERSCNTYFWSMGLRTDPQQTTDMVRLLGYGEKFDLPLTTQSFGTMPGPEWLMRKYKRKWQGYDSANTSIGQGYVLINPLQLAVMPGRLGSGKIVQPRLLMNAPRKPIRPIVADPEHIAFIRNAMGAVVNGSGTGVGSKLLLDGVQMAGKTGTAQVYRLTARGVANSNWALRDHALFIAFAPVDKPRYSIGCIIEHGGFGAASAAPIVRDCMTYMFDQQNAWAALGPLEQSWGGSLAERTAARNAQFERIARANALAKRA